MASSAASGEAFEKGAPRRRVHASFGFVIRSCLTVRKPFLHGDSEAYLRRRALGGHMMGR
jgi:hypothetical protein